MVQDQADHIKNAELDTMPYVHRLRWLAPARPHGLRSVARVLHLSKWRSAA
jgi:hypothetical protein